MRMMDIDRSKWVSAEMYGEALKRATDLAEDNRLLRAEGNDLHQWIDDLLSGMYVNCVYCGHRYGPSKKTPVSMADVLKAHIEICPKHPMSALKKRIEELESDAKLGRIERGILKP
jgi:hypothetical protein